MSLAQPDGYLAIPASGTGSPVLVLHAWWGLNDTMKGVCQRLAEAGFIAFAPDLYHGKVTDQIPEAEALSSALDARQAVADITAASAFLKARTGAAALAVLGFSLGAYFALAFSAKAPETVKSVVVFYGTGPEDFSPSQAAYLGHFAENDEFEPLAGVDALEAALRRAGRPATIHHYPGTGHWFFEPDRAQAYHPEAANLAWERTIAFLKETSRS